MLSFRATRPSTAGSACVLEPRPPALVMGSGITALGVVQSLGRAALPLHVLTSEPGFVRSSRWYQAPPYSRYLRDPSDLTEYLRDLPIERGVLFPTSDHEAAAVAALPPELTRRFMASQTAEPVLTDLLDKEGLRRMLVAHDIPHPATISVEGPEDLDVLEQGGAPFDLSLAFIKPRDSQEFNRRLRVKAIRPEGKDELRQWLSRLASQNLSVVLQEYIPGPPTNHYFLDGFVDRTGEVRARFARRRLRMSSSDFGNSCATISVPLEEMAPAAADLDRLLSAVRYRGPFDAEFKLDERDGTFRLLEINVRPWWQVEFAAVCGVDVVPMAYRDALGLDVQGVDDYQVGVEWILPYHDLAACKHLLGTGELTLTEWVRSWLSSRWGGFALDDPLPGFAAGLELWRRFRRRQKAARDPGLQPAPG